MRKRKMSSDNLLISNGIGQPATWSYTTTSQDKGDSDMVQSTTIVKVAGALLRAQRNMGGAVKDAKNPFFKSSYANLNSVREASHPSLNAEGIVVLQPTISRDGKSYVRTLLLHESGEYIGSDTEIVCSKQNDAQAQGSAISYSRRYGLQSLLSLGTADDDGEATMNRTSPVKEWAKPMGAVTIVDVPSTNTTVATKSNGSFKKPQAKATPVVDTAEGWD